MSALTREPRVRRSKPDGAPAANDDETQDHLLSDVADGVKVGCVGAIAKAALQLRDRRAHGASGKAKTAPV